MKRDLPKPTFKEEKLLWNRGYRYVVGMDEVGRGSFAGPVVTAAVVFSKNIDLSLCKGINDSKMLKPLVRIQLAKEIKKICTSFAVEQSSVSIINKLGIGKATTIAFRKVVAKLTKDKGIRQSNGIFILVDGFHIKYLRGFGLKNQKAIIKGDQKSISIAAASILAKVYRDNLMMRLHEKYPMYGFAQHKGYGTKQHQHAIKKYGLSAIHRTSFDLSPFLM